MPGLDASSGGWALILLPLYNERQDAHAYLKRHREDSDTGPEIPYRIVRELAPVAHTSFPGQCGRVTPGACSGPGALGQFKITLD